MRQGDVVHLRVNAAYETGSGKVQGLEGIATEVAGALEQTATGLESGGAASGTNGLTAGSALSQGQKPGVPAAYLNYLVYDHDYQLIDQGFAKVSEEAAVQVGSRNSGSAEALVLDVDIDQTGYLYAYLSNEGADLSANSNAGTPIHFDDFESSTKASASYSITTTTPLEQLMLKALIGYSRTATFTRAKSYRIKRG